MRHSLFIVALASAIAMLALLALAAGKRRRWLSIFLSTSRWESPILCLPSLRQT